MKRKAGLFSVIAVLVLMLVGVLVGGCTAGDRLTEAFYTTNIYNADGFETGTFRLTTPVYASVDVPVTSMLLIGTHAAEYKPFNGVLAMVFTDEAVEANEKEAYFIVEVPHGYVEGSEVMFYIHYVFNANRVGQEVKWGLEYTWANQNALYLASSTVYRVSDSANNDANYHHWNGFTAINGAGKTIGSVLACRLFRNSSSADDTYDSDVQVLCIDLVCEVDALGSTQRTVK